jgi:hypothetical protein
MMQSSIRSFCNPLDRKISIATRSDLLTSREFFIELITVCIGANCCTIEYWQEILNVEPYHPQYRAMRDIAIVKATSACNDPEAGITYIIIFNQALDFTETLPLILVNPNQTRVNGIVVDDIAKHLANSSTKATHSIYMPKHDLCTKLQM